MPRGTSSPSLTAPTPAQRRARRDPSTSGEEDDLEDGTQLSRLKRMNEELREQISNATEARKKRRKKTSNIWLGRGIKKLASLFEDVRQVVADNDLYLDFLERNAGDKDPSFDLMDPEEKVATQRQWKCSHEAFRIINQLVPNFQSFIDNADPAELTCFYEELDKGSCDARGDDIKKLKASVANWLNQAYPNQKPLLDPNCRLTRGIQHETTGRLLCPIEFNWENENTRQKLRTLCVEEGFDIASSFFCRCFYAGYEGDPNDVEQGFLRSPLLIKAYKHIFTSPLSAEEVGVEDRLEESGVRNPFAPKRKKTHRKSICHILNMESTVTPRSIAYACVQLHFSLMNPEAWTISHSGIDYRELYNFIVDFFEDVNEIAIRQRNDALIKWWNRQIFPNKRVSSSQKAGSSSRLKLLNQRTASARRIN